MRTVHLPQSGTDWIAIRTGLGLTKAELARRTALDVRTIWELEHDGDVSDRVRLLVAAALGLPVFPPVEAVRS